MKKVIVFGGGSGLSCLLSGLKLFPLEVTTVIAVSDNGSSTGVLKEEFDIPAVGDMSYEKMFCESSLMVTDYSGIQFDFAYMRKPVIYYQPEELPPHYEEGGLIYETMGFGPICRTHRQIVDTLCQYIASDCVNDNEYVRRANDFFAFYDHKNCERIYDAVMDYSSRISGHADHI